MFVLILILGFIVAVDVFVCCLFVRSYKKDLEAYKQVVEVVEKRLDKLKARVEKYEKDKRYDNSYNDNVADGLDSEIWL